MFTRFYDPDWFKKYLLSLTSQTLKIKSFKLTLASTLKLQIHETDITKLTKKSPLTYFLSNETKTSFLVGKHSLTHSK